MRSVFTLLALSAVVAGEDARLKQIAERVAANQARLPSYTCGQTTERWKRGVECAGCESTDRLRLDVAVIGGQELFAWPGGSAFEDRGLSEAVAQRGMVLAGDYSAILDDLFLSGDAEFIPGPEKQVRGRRALEYSYRVLGRRAGLEVRIEGRDVLLPYRGKFWADAETLDLTRLELDVEEIPPALNLESGKASMDYQRARFPGAELLLPGKVESDVKLRDGRRFRNRTAYTGCRQYAANSTIRFGESAAPPPLPDAALEAAPEGLTVISSPSPGIDLDRCAVGDELTFIVQYDADHNGFRIPKGAVIRGRIVGFASITSPARAVFLRVRTSVVEFGGRRAAFRSRLIAAARWISSGGSSPVNVEPGISDDDSFVSQKIDPRRPLYLSQFTWRTLKP